LATLLCTLTIVVEFHMYALCGIEGDIQTWFLDMMVVLDHVTDLLAALSFWAHGHAGFATASLWIIAVATTWGVIVTAGELLDDELERRCAAYISGLFACQSPFWQTLSAKLVHRTEDVVMPFISLGGLIPILGTMASWAEDDHRRQEEKDMLSAQIRALRGMVGSAPQFVLTLAYILYHNQWNDFLAVISLTSSLIVGVYGLAAEAERAEIGDFFLGGHYRSAKANAATERSSFKKGSAPAATQKRDQKRQRRPSVSSISPDKMQSWVKSQAEQVVQKEAHLVRVLMVYYGLDLFLRAVTVASCLASWQYGGASQIGNWAVMLGGWVYLTASAAAFPTRGQTVGYLALSDNPSALWRLPIRPSFGTRDPPNPCTRGPPNP